MALLSRLNYNKPTPARIAFILNIIMAISGAVGGWLGTNNFVPAHISTVIQSFLGLIVLLCVAIKPYFGVNPPKDPVPVEDIKEIEDKPENKTP